MQNFVKRVCALEEELFVDQLDPEDSTRMLHDGYSWLYRPSHHIASGLLAHDDITFLSKKGHRLLSVGAWPAFLERTLVALGIPKENIVVADINPDIEDCTREFERVVFDMTRDWPEIGTFDRIIFPESLCIAIADILHETNFTQATGAHPSDALEAHILAHVMEEALTRLRTGGVIRANGPMSHPKVVQAMTEILNAEDCPHTVEYKRFLLTIARASDK